MVLPGRHLLAPSRQRRAPTSGQLARRRFLVRWTKRLLPALALLLLAAVAFWPELEGNEDRSRVSFRRTVQPRAEALRVVNPRYQGIDDQNRPFTVTALVGQQPGSAEILELDAPRADITLTDGAWVHLSARRGRFDRPAQHLDLAGEVTINHDDGTQLVTETAAVEIEAGSASGDSPVAAQGGFGTLTAEGFRLTERGAVILFTGQSHAVLEGGE
ncbi:LPS export ABC transporter periplasmic protein LptC [Siccirubricoccus sp. KC 17139]|uniref:LPS export ABC transporter periplasmic protein LptC n=1 Tax=Siccirubricoccus soli TaxID=2899147 RepID=A0ABT1D9E1_9PROT|nr:LPS export ABC transporter periplasmic protein LptC [Siccirubricoccus soli]MCO6418489.1 LPS export ABC transporter periplasmic protein LptC [Siccirubricoccus soli]MCP2684624.1 LPS export ABC transporter periplasmic protein LptC [Siccirubricoccus soli]